MTLGHTDLLDSARRLLAGSEPTSADLRRATSTTYYAMFHALAATIAALVVGDGPHRDETAWLLAYRALDHRAARNACREAAVSSQIPPALQAFAGRFVVMQDRRHEADYDPAAVFILAEVQNDLDATAAIVTDFLAVPEPARRAFCAGILFRRRV